MRLVDGVNERGVNLRDNATRRDAFVQSDRSWRWCNADGFVRQTVDGNEKRATEKTAVNPFSLSFGWGGDLNPRPLGYEPNELPDCSTPRHGNCSIGSDWSSRSKRSGRIRDQVVDVARGGTIVKGRNYLAPGDLPPGRSSAGGPCGG